MPVVMAVPNRVLAPVKEVTFWVTKISATLRFIGKGSVASPKEVTIET